jgi:spore maturation protein CgeB
MTQTILHYLCHDEEREQITQNAYELMVNQLTMRQSMQMIMQEVAKRRT